MRPLYFLVVLALPLLLTACDNAPEPPAPAAQAAPAEQPAEPIEAAAEEAPTAEAPAPPADAAPPGEAALAPLVCNWAADPASCSSPIAIDAASFKGAENICEITGWTDNGDGTYTANLSCTGEGQTVEERIAMTPLFGPSGEGIRLDYLDRGGDPVTVFRCSAGRGQ